MSSGEEFIPGHKHRHSHGFSNIFSYLLLFSSRNNASWESSINEGSKISWRLNQRLRGNAKADGIINIAILCDAKRINITIVNDDRIKCGYDAKHDLIARVALGIEND